MKVLLFLIVCLFLSWGIAIEPPFDPNVLQLIQKLSSVPTVIDPSQGLEGIDPTANSQDNTKLSQPNPLADAFPKLATGTINTTLAVLPIDYALARSIIPKKHAILKNSIRQALPCFPKHKYPLVISTQIDHDIHFGGSTLPDYHSALLRFPFVDLLGDGYSTFTYQKTLYISNNSFAIVGYANYGDAPIVATFQPPKDPYAFAPVSKATKAGEYFSNVVRDGLTVLKTTYAPQPGEAGLVGAYPLSFYANITNMPTFSCQTSKCVLGCDNLLQFFRTNVTTGRFRPIGVTGHVSLAKSAPSGIDVFPNGFHFHGVHGVKLTIAYLDYFYKNCSGLKGLTYLDY